jgi:hypothetical protein
VNIAPAVGAERIAAALVEQDEQDVRRLDIYGHGGMSSGFSLRTCFLSAVGKSATLTYYYDAS